MKWGLVAASLSDMQRPVEDVSVGQCSGRFYGGGMGAKGNESRKLTVC